MSYTDFLRFDKGTRKERIEKENREAEELKALKADEEIEFCEPEDEEEFWPRYEDRIVRPFNRPKMVFFNYKSF